MKKTVHLYTLKQPCRSGFHHLIRNVQSYHQNSNNRVQLTTLETSTTLINTYTLLYIEVLGSLHSDWKANSKDNLRWDTSTFFSFSSVVPFAPFTYTFNLCKNKSPDAHNKLCKSCTDTKVLHRFIWETVTFEVIFLLCWHLLTVETTNA